MRRWGVAAFVVAALALGGAAAPPIAASGYAPAEVAFTFRDVRITESSGVAVASYDDRVMFTHNDSGDPARFFAVGPDGETLITFNVSGAGAVDWEDMAAGPSSVPTTTGRSLYFGDFGNNGRDRGVVVVYEVAEPVVAVESAGAAAEEAVAVIATRSLSWGGVPHDCETLLVDPQGRLYLVAKVPTGRSGVYEARGGSLVEVASIFFPGFIAPDSRLAYLPAYVRGGTQATGGDISHDGTKLVVRTYTDAYEWDIPGGDLAAALASPPARVAVPLTTQAEAITYTAAGDLLTTTEGANAPVHRLRVATG